MTVVRRLAARRLPARSWPCVALAVAVILAGCTASTPTATPPLAQISLPPSSGSSPATSADSNATPAIADLLASMSAKVMAGDRAAYLSLVDLSDPIFALEHGRWADDWSGPHPVEKYGLGISDLAVEGNTAIGRLTVTWVLRDNPEQRAATFDAHFTRGPDGWRYAGEAWVETEVPHFRILVAPGLENTVAGLAADLPGVYDGVTTELGYAPAAPLVIKLYPDGMALVANTLLSLPEIRGWNEPGEALKLRYDHNDPLAPVIAHEFTHFSTFDRAGTKRTRMPWWLDEGLATYVAEPFEGPAARDRLGQVVAWAAAGQLAPWASMTVFEETPLDLWTYAYPQGYAMVRYVTETYGVVKRNAWLAAMATDMTIDEATPSVFRRSFDDVDRDFRAWLAKQAGSGG